jgi:Tfp pilus assembly protein PilX
MRVIQAAPKDQRGVALILTLLLAFLVAALAIGAVMMSGNVQTGRIGCG